MQNQTSIANASSAYDATAEQADIEFDVSIASQNRYFSLDQHLFVKLKEIAQQQGVSIETLLNLWVKEKISKTNIESIEKTTLKRVFQKNNQKKSA